MAILEYDAYKSYTTVKEHIRYLKTLKKIEIYFDSLKIKFNRIYNIIKTNIEYFMIKHFSTTRIVLNFKNEYKSKDGRYKKTSDSNILIVDVNRIKELLEYDRSDKNNNAVYQLVEKTDDKLDKK